MDEGIEKQMASTNRRQKIFNVRKLHHKHFDPHDKYIKPQFSPLQVKEHFQEPSTQKVGKKATEYNFQIAIISSAPYKELNKRYGQLKEENQREKQKRLKQLKEKEEQLIKFQAERQRLTMEREKLAQRRDEIKNKVEEIRGRNEQLRSQQMQRSKDLKMIDEQYRVMNMEYLRNMLMSVRYQNGVDIDIDNMNYEQLLQLEEKIGNVSKGLTEEQLSKLHVKKASGKGEEAGEGLCSICYDDIKEGQQILTLPCRHVFHNCCIKEWLGKQKACPMCKQQIILEASRASQRKIQETNSRVEESSNSRVEEDNQS